MKLRFSEPFYSVIKKIEQLQEYDRYQSAYIFGSVVRGEQNKDSDLDVMVVVNENNDCKEINHPIINGIKLDLTFRSIQQIRKINEEVVQKGERIPMLAESIIIFDKTGELTQLKNRFKNIKRKKATKKDFHQIHFMLYHADNKAKRNLKDDKPTAFLALSINLNDVLRFHYHINGKWWLSNKRLLPDLRKWDYKMAELIEKFVATSDLSRKYEVWSKILDHVAKPIGGRKEIKDINCGCRVCKRDLTLLQKNLSRITKNNFN